MLFNRLSVKTFHCHVSRHFVFKGLFLLLVEWLGSFINIKCNIMMYLSVFENHKLILYWSSFSSDVIEFQVKPNRTWSAIGWLTATQSCHFYKLIIINVRFVVNVKVTKNEDSMNFLIPWYLLYVSPYVCKIFTVPIQNHRTSVTECKPKKSRHFVGENSSLFKLRATRAIIRGDNSIHYFVIIFHRKVRSGIEKNESS